jgi:hypothetical protein
VRPTNNQNLNKIKLKKDRKKQNEINNERRRKTEAK